MQIIRNFNQIKEKTSSQEPICVTIGNFDGVHLGHLELLKKVQEIAAKKKLKTAVVTFEPHPASFFNAEKRYDFRINSLAQKLAHFQKLGFDQAIILPFNQETHEISATDFVEKILLKNLQTAELVIGYDFIFGKNRQGNFALLQELSKQHGFGLTEVSAFEKDQKICSSSLIRQLLKSGQISLANQFLGKNFSVCGLVNSGRKLARNLGFPTANMSAKNHILQVKFGVYHSQVFLPHLNKYFAAITNFGIKPTVENKGLKPIYETHIFGFNEEIYGKKIVVELLEFIREEKKFASIDELKNQIAADVKIAQNLPRNFS